MSRIRFVRMEFSDSHFLHLSLEESLNWFILVQFKEKILNAHIEPDRSVTFLPDPPELVEGDLFVVRFYKSSTGEPFAKMHITYTGNWGGKYYFSKEYFPGKTTVVWPRIETEGVILQ